MLEKIKAILGDVFTEEIGQRLDAAFTENSKVAELETAAARVSELEGQLDEAGKTIETFKAMDIDSIKKAADDWKFKAEQAESNAAAKISDMQFQTALTGAIGTAKGKNAKAIMALLDVDALKESKNQAEDIKSAIDSIAKENEYMFDKI